MSSILAYVVVGWNNRQFLANCLNSIASQDGVTRRAYYIDNASSDDSVKYVKQNFPNVQVIQNKSNLGFAKANNIGMKQAIKDGAKYIVLLNTDAEISSGWTKKIVNFVEDHSDVAAVQGITMRKKEENLIDSSGIYLDQGLRATQTDFMKKNKKKYAYREVFGVNAAAALYTVDFLNSQPFKEEYFDEDFFMYLEDVDLSLRALELGYKNYCVGDAIAYHVGSASSKGQKFAYKYSYRNHLPMLFKNFPVKFIVSRIPRIMVADLKRMRDFHRNGQNDVVWAMIKGRIIGLTLLPKMHKKRKLLINHAKSNLDYIISLTYKGYINN